MGEWERGGMREWKIAAENADRCGEAPIWDHRSARLLWTDIPADIVYTLHPATGQTSVASRGVSVSGIALDRGGGLVLAGSGGLHLLDPDGACRPIVRDHEGTPLLFNDLLADPAGRIYAGTIYWDEEMEKPGALYLIHPGGQIETVDDGIELANGLALSPDDRTLYFADSAARRIYAFEVDPRSGRLSNRRTLAHVSVDDGIPDGLTSDSEGFLWCACWYGGQVVRFDPEGCIERRVRLPVRQVSSLAFGGPHYGDLYVTTAAEPWPSRLAPAHYDPGATNQGGALYRMPAPVPGRAEHAVAFGPNGG